MRPQNYILRTEDTAITTGDCISHHNTHTHTGILLAFSNQVVKFRDISIIIKHYFRRVQLLLLRARLHVSTLIIGQLQASLQLGLQTLYMLDSLHVHINEIIKFMFVNYKFR